jgi:glycolate oxidase FAD binding subunit
MIAAPSSTAEAATLLKESRGVVIVRGAGTKQDWGYPPPEPDLILDTTAMTGIVEHVPGDLVVVVRAGTPLSELQAALAEKAQQLALDSPHPEATVGGVVATNVSGPRRLRYGAARDLLIGITVVRPDGVIARAGGKVVKNVAGYDLGKLFVGSYGTLGLITECAFRLHPLPTSLSESRETARDVQSAVALAASARTSPLTPIAIELDWPPGSPLEVSVLYEGVPEWQLPWRTGDLGLKLTCALSRLPRLLAGVAEAAARHDVTLHVRGSLGVGVLYAGAPGAPPGFVDDVRAVAHDAGGHAVVLTYREGLDLWGPVPGLELMRRVKDQFDPGRRFAPGRFVSGM